MGIVISYFNNIKSQKTIWKIKKRICANCNIQINLNDPISELWCTNCDRVWCDTCWSSSVESITKFAYKNCGYCDKYDSSSIKSLLYDLIMKDNNVDNIHLPTLCDKYKVRNKLISHKFYDEEKRNIIFDNL